MKKIYFILLVALSAFSLTSCSDDDSEGVTQTTVYPTITILGDQRVIVTIGSPYNDAGCTAELFGKDVTSEIEVENNVDASKMGIYSVSYTGYSAEGFSLTLTRDVYVTNPGHINTLYYGKSSYGTRSYSNAPVIITDNGNGTYTIDDILGGFYWFGRYPSYEPTYDFHAESVIKVNEDNTISLLETGSWYWDSNEIKLKEGTYNPETGVISLVMSFGGSDFTVGLTPIE